ncbi:DNA/RNA non-specific endonuclease [Streptomyces yerevanensis]|uniref:DNA/RNA non-specific endonuclease n=1 Tax=Streptomyces yerevanensis TaxID=66378 RepID=UPI000B1C1384|nr:DNA/RNA non-specific endonuclease [Streptomyces yerevanensis]
MHGIPGGRATRRRARSTVLTVLTALTLVLTTAATSQAAEPPATAKASSTTKSAAPSAETTETSKFAAGSGEDCTATAPGSKERRAGAVESCVTVTPAPAKAKTRAAAAAPAASAAAAAAGSCDITSPGNYNYERFSYCVNGINVTYILRDSKGVEIGRGVLEVSTGGDLSPTATTWSEQVSVTMTSAVGDVTALNAKLRASCDAGCTATKTAPWYGGNITLGQTLTGNVTYSSPQTTGSSASFYTAYAMYVTSPGATATDPNASWKNSRQIRCDNAVGGTSVAGCAVPSVMPELLMSTQGSDRGGAVAAYLWAQKNLTDRWGLNAALTRSTGGVDVRTSSTCGSGASEPFADASDLIPTDTCAQFPFAETKEGGRDGAECAELIPYYGNGGWVIHELNGGSSLDTSQRCVRAHVAAVDKQFAVSQLADGFAGQRVIDADQFKLTFTASLDGSHAECLGISPEGARPAGNGWIKNTVEPVPHVNKTDQTSAAGYRASTATVCLGTQPGPGSTAGGDITGWADAAAYRTKNNLTEGLSRCHLIANVLGGRISQNLVPCWQAGMNTGADSMWDEGEQKVWAELNDDTFSDDDAILYQVTPTYLSSGSTIPVGVTMSAKIQRADGSVEQLFPDVYVANTQTGGQHNLGN